MKGATCSGSMNFQSEGTHADISQPCRNDLLKTMSCGVVRRVCGSATYYFYVVRLTLPRGVRDETMDECEHRRWVHCLLDGTPPLLIRADASACAQDRRGAMISLFLQRVAIV